jgi:hypothetical protein
MGRQGGKWGHSKRAKEQVVTKEAKQKATKMMTNGVDK